MFPSLPNFTYSAKVTKIIGQSRGAPDDPHCRAYRGNRSTCVRAAHEVGGDPATGVKTGVPKTRSLGPDRGTEGLGAIKPT